MGSLSLGRSLASTRALPHINVAPGLTSPVVNTPLPAAPVGTTTAIDSNTSAGDVTAERVNAILKQKRGLSGTVATSWRGLLQDAMPTLSRKTLLGE